MGAITRPTAGAVFGFLFKPRLILNARQELGYTIRIFVRVIAILFIQVGLLPPAHGAAKVASLHDPDLTVGAVVGDAWRALDWKDGRQIAVFGTLMLFFASLALGLLTAFAQEFVGSAWAADAWPSITSSQNIAARWLRGVFGISSNGSPAEFGSTLGAMLFVYNSTALGMGTLLASYGGVVIVMESAKHGRVGGQRHSMLWAPIRLVFGLGLLAPVADGWNGGQLAAVWVAGQGSIIASSVWTAFTDKIASGQGAVVTPPMSTPLEPVVGTLLAMETCAQGMNGLAAKLGDADYIQLTVARQVKPFTDGDTYAVERSYDGVRFYPRKACGAVRFVPPKNGDYSGDKQMIAAQRDALIAVLPDIQALAHQIIAANDPNPAMRSPMPSTVVGQQIVERYTRMLISSIGPATAAQNAEARSKMVQETHAAGWVAAPAWLHTISRLNSELLKAAATPPEVTGPAVGLEWPEEVRASIGGAEAYWNAVSADLGIPAFQSVSAGSQAGILDRIFSPIGFTTVKMFKFSGTDPLSEVIAFGHTILAWAIGILTIMAGAVGWANSPGFAAAIGLMGGPTGVAASLAAQKAIGSGLAAILQFLAPLIAGILLLLLSSAALLAVGLAVLPLTRWLFGCISWLLGIFEAIVAVPIMLIAHLRSDGEGLAGPSAQMGYTILLGLFLRPILMVFSLVVGLQIFNSVMWLWNLLFLPNMMASAASGNTMGFVVGVIYVVVYCTSVYAFANASFKAIDYLPNQVLRWIGGQVMHDMDNSAMIERASQQAGQGVGEGQKSLMKSAQGDESKSPTGRGATTEKSGDSITQSMLPNPDQRGFR